jgi:sulfur-oxidizing protein SoxB
MFSRRDFVQLAAATAVLTGTPGRLARAAARQEITQKDLLRFEPLGQVTLLHIADIHAQLVPIYFREPSVNLGVGEAHGLPPRDDARGLCPDQRGFRQPGQDLWQGRRRRPVGDPGQGNS